jgi:hypothetical protein
MDFQSLKGNSKHQGIYSFMIDAFLVFGRIGMERKSFYQKGFLSMNRILLPKEKALYEAWLNYNRSKRRMGSLHPCAFQIHSPSNGMLFA